MQLNPIHKKDDEVFFLYQDDPISRVLPGKKDVISTKRGDSTKEKKRRLLLNDISNVQRTYLEQHPFQLIGKSKFFQLKSL